jgi:hypothetical protein
MKNIDRYANLSLNPQMSKAYLMPASIWKRAAGFMIDLAIVDIVIFAPFRGIFTGLMGNAVGYSEAFSALTSSQENLTKLMSIGVYMSILLVLYFTLLEWKIQQTPGKILMNTYIMSDKKIGFWQVLLSNLTLVPFFPFILLWIVDLINVLFTKNNQRFMEKIARVSLVEMKVVDYYQNGA